MKTNKKRIIAIFLVILISLIISFNLVGCKADYYTEEQHIERISERVKKKLAQWSNSYNSDTVYTGFEVYPLYDENERMTHCLVELEPYGFTIILIKDEELKIWSCIGASTSMYKECSMYNNYYTWSPYEIDETEPELTYSNGIRWKLDENGEKICYSKSPYCVTDSLNKRKYLIEEKSSGAYICAIKNGDTFFNLISETPCDFSKKQATIGLHFWPYKKYDL